MKEYVLIVISAVFVNNIVLTRFLGICPFLGVSRRLSSALGMSAGVMFVMTLATAVTGFLDRYVLQPRGLGFLRTVLFILVIAALVQAVEIVLKKVSPALYRALGVYLPLITTNCAILGVALLAGQEGMDIGQAIVFSLANGAGFSFALLLFSGIRERMELSDIPEALQGVPIALITAGLLSMAFMGFAGIVR